MYGLGEVQLISIRLNLYFTIVKKKKVHSKLFILDLFLLPIAPPPKNLRELKEHT